MKSIRFAVVSVLGVGIVVLGLESARRDLSHVAPSSGAGAVMLAQPASAAATEAPPPPPARASQAAQAREVSEAPITLVRAQEAVPPPPPGATPPQEEKEPQPLSGPDPDPRRLAATRGTGANRATGRPLAGE